MTNDDRFDELLQEAAREHNRAPETPRAEMWAAIAAARGTARPGTAVAGSGAAEPARPVTVRVIPFYTRHRRAIGWVAGLAATLLVGVELGRLSMPSATVEPTATVASRGAATPPNVTPAPETTGSTPRDSGSATQRAPTVLAARGQSRGASHGDMRASARQGARETVDEGLRQAALPYRVAAVQHLVTTEALLVSLRADVREGRKDTTIAVWAGQLLGTTRMLIDSPAGRDPQLKQLLDDLELVLAQISRLPGARGQAADLGIIEDAVRHRQIMTRLRALSPDT